MTNLNKKIGLFVTESMFVHCMSIQILIVIHGHVYKVHFTEVYTNKNIQVNNVNGELSMCFIVRVYSCILELLEVN